MDQLYYGQSPRLDWKFGANTYQPKPPKIDWQAFCIGVIVVLIIGWLWMR